MKGSAKVKREALQTRMGETGQLSLNKIVRFLKGLFLPLVTILLWEVLSQSGYLNDYLIPPPAQIWDRLIIVVLNGELIKHLSASLYRVLIGFSLALCLALPLGFLLGLIPSIRNFVSPSLNFFQQIPAIAWIPMFILWLGIDEASKLAIIIYSAFFPIFINTMHGIALTDPKLKEVASTYVLSNWALITRVYLPSSAPSVFIGMRLGLSFSWRSLVAAELIGASKGIGYLIQEGREMSQPDLMLLGVLLIGLTGLSLDYLLQRLEGKVLPWHHKADTQEVRTCQTS